MFKKLFSLIIIALMLLSVIGFASAGMLYMHYPDKNNNITNPNKYRYDHEPVEAAIAATKEDWREKFYWYDVYSKVNEYGIRAYNLPRSDIEIYHGVWDCLLVNYGDKNTFLPGTDYCYNLSVMKGSDKDKLTVALEDGTWPSHQYAWLKIWNYQPKYDVYVTYWDRGATRNPHIEVTYKGKFYDGKNGDDITINDPW
jgi:hypothetical protein